MEFKYVDVHPNFWRGRTPQPIIPVIGSVEQFAHLKTIFSGTDLAVLRLVTVPEKLRGIYFERVLVFNELTDSQKSILEFAKYGRFGLSRKDQLMYDRERLMNKMFKSRVEHEELMAIDHELHHLEGT